MDALIANAVEAEREYGYRSPEHVMAMWRLVLDAPDDMLIGDLMDRYYAAGGFKPNDGTTRTLDMGRGS